MKSFLSFTFLRPTADSRDAKTKRVLIGDRDGWWIFKRGGMFLPRGVARAVEEQDDALC